MSKYWDWDNGCSQPDLAYCQRFYNRTVDLVKKYQPDLLYFDDTVLPLWPVSDAGLKIAAVAVVCLVGAAPGGIVLPHRPSDWVSVVYMAVVAGALAMLGQTWAQAHLDSTRAAIIMSMEPVFAALFAVLAGQESITWRMLVGGPLVLAAMLLVELMPRRRPRFEELPS